MKGGVLSYLYLGKKGKGEKTWCGGRSPESIRRQEKNCSQFTFKSLEGPASGPRKSSKEKWGEETSLRERGTAKAGKLVGNAVPIVRHLKGDRKKSDLIRGSRIKVGRGSRIDQGRKRGQIVSPLPGPEM